MQVFRIGDKMVSRDKIDRAVDRILELRHRGLSQQDVSQRVGVDRTFVSRLEGLGEIRKGGSIAVIGFPLANVDELRAVAHEEGVDYVLLMTDAERWAYVQQRSGLDVLNEVMATAAELREYSAVIVLGSDKRIKLFEAFLDKDVIGVVIGDSPIQGDRRFDPERLRELIRELR